MRISALTLLPLALAQIEPQRLFKRQSVSGKYKTPKPSVEVYFPKGLLVWIPDAPGIQLFNIEYDLNKEVSQNSSTSETEKPDDEGNWAVFFKDAQIKVGDVIYLNVRVVKYGRSYRLKGFQIKIEKFYDEEIEETAEGTPASVSLVKSTEKPEKEEKQESTTEGPCVDSETTVNGKKVCENKVILEETFKNEYLFNSKKKLEDLLLSEMGSSVLEPKDSNFMFYTKKHNKAKIKDNILIISPGFITEFNDDDDDIVEDGLINIANCTSKIVGSCDKQAYGWSILPPIHSARLTTKDVFSFRYGTIEIWAKLPMGNWIVPEIWLEQATGDYRNYNGKIYLAYALGNSKLNMKDGSEIGYNVKKQGYRIGNFKPIFYNKTMGKTLSNHFHQFKLIWKPDSLSFYINDELIRQIKPMTYLTTFVKKSKLSPFDQEYFLTIGLHVGGGDDFPEGVISSGQPKPWLNDDLKGMANFWKSRKNWLHTWNHNSKLMISKIKVTSV